MSNPFEIPAPEPTVNAPSARAGANPFEAQEHPGHARGASAASSHEEFSNPFESPGRAARGGGFEGEVPLPDVPLPGANAYEAEGGGDVNSTFGAYDVAANQGGETGVEMGAPPSQPRGGFRSSATAVFKSAFGGRSSNPAPSRSAFGGGGAMDGASSASLAAQQRDLERREQEVLRRERDLEARERAVRDAPSGGGSGALNWPFKWYAIAYHSIADEIPPRHKRCVTLCYTVYVLFAVAMLFNCFVTFIRIFQKGDLSSFLMSFIYMVCGVPGAWMLWYRRVYNTFKADRAFGFLWFFLMFLVHIGFVTFAALAPPGFFGAQQWATCGLLNLTEALNSHKIIGIMHAIVMSMLMADAVLSVVCIRMVYSSFRSDGHSIQQAREEAYREGARAAMTGGIGSAAV